MDNFMGHDVQYNRVAGYYVMTSVSLSLVLGFGVHLSRSYLKRLTAESYCEHFYAMLVLVPALLTQSGDPAFVGCVDFADAQRKGFQGAVGRRRLEIGGSETVPSFADCVKAGKNASNWLKGCLFHFKQSVKRVAQISMCFPKDDSDEFAHFAGSLRTAPAPQFPRLLKKIRKRWPAVEKWLKWWLHEERAKLIFQCKSAKETDDLRAAAPSTDNFSEASNSKEQRLYPTANVPLVVGVERDLTLTLHDQEEYFRITKEGPRRRPTLKHRHLQKNKRGSKRGPAKEWDEKPPETRARLSSKRRKKT
jgi:hypothetical protein